MTNKNQIGSQIFISDNTFKRWQLSITYHAYMHIITYYHLITFNQFIYAQNTVLAIIKELDFSLVTISSQNYNIGSIPYLLLKKTLSSLFYFNMPAGSAFTQPKKLSDDLADICGVEVCTYL